VVICDTGPIFAAADRWDADHHACVELFTGLRLAGRRLLLPQTVMAEVGYMLEAKVGTFAEVACCDDLTPVEAEQALYAHHQTPTPVGVSN
jgi:predicted nucleic acid-binding protein